MSKEYWQAQHARAVSDLMSTGAQMGADWRARREEREEVERLKAEYQAALEKGKTTGVMPEEFQRDVPADYMGKQTGIEVVALRELGKRAPNHPLVLSQECRDAVGAVTLIQYNRAGRLIEQPYADFAPDDEVADRIFEAYAIEGNSKLAEDSLRTERKIIDEAIKAERIKTVEPLMARLKKAEEALKAETKRADEALAALAAYKT